MRAIPSIEQLRQRPAMQALELRFGRVALVDALRATADDVRTRLRAGDTITDVAAAIEAHVEGRLSASTAPSLVEVINATGVIIHTNLGRAPLAEAAASRVAALATGYTNLEYDVAAGTRGRRDVHAEQLLCRLTGAHAAVVVNNNAAATMIVLAALAYGREVIISRGELVEIGGGFRVPDVMAQSGAVLREVGTTNRTRASDYAAAVNERTALILRVHPSNFRVEGFTERPRLEEIVDVGRTLKIPVAEDLGSGYLTDGDRAPALRDEPSVADSLTAGADVVTFSGDKLLGGPQAGIIAGSTAAVTAIRRHPLMRALRVDKLTYAALEATLELYVTGRRADVPVARMIDMAIDDIDARARALAATLADGGYGVEIVGGHSTIGGGSAPGSAIETRLVALTHPSKTAAELEAALRALAVPVIARIEADRVCLDLRTVQPADDPRLSRLLLSLTA